MITNSDLDIITANSDNHFEDAGQLFKEYAHAINFDAGFKNFTAELAALKTIYLYPKACLLLAYLDGKAVGCVAVNNINGEVAELRRFYVQPEFRKFKIGAKLLNSAIKSAKKLKFSSLRLEVIPTLIKAKELYESFGFYRIEPFKKVDMEGTVYMELMLSENASSANKHKLNAWNNVPLEDYERHMEHQTVSQAQLLNSLTNNYLQKYAPKNILFLGVSGGNGLEHIDLNKINTVYGIDINQSYLDVAKERYAKMIKNLVLVNVDISNSTETFIKADFIWAALIFEYIDVEKGFSFITRNCSNRARLIVTIQSNNGNQSVSQTGVESIKSIKDLFKIVDKQELQLCASAAGFELIGSEENKLPNGKSLLTYEFSKEEGK